MKRLASLLATLCLFQSSHAATAVPDAISFQGRALTATGALMGAGTPVNRTVTFRIWDHPSNSLVTNLLYSEQQVVTIAEGEFSVLIGTGTATAGTPLTYPETEKGLPTVKISDAFGGVSRYLGVTIDDGTDAVDNEISPRQQFVTSTYAMRSKVAEGVDSSAITTAMLANNSVTTTQVNDAAITTSKLADNAVTATQIVDATITTAKLADASVTTDKIANLNVTTAKLADANVTTDKIANLNVTTDKIAAGAVTGAKIASGTIAAGNLATGAVTSTAILDGTIATADIANSTITSAKIADGNVTGSDIAYGTITSDNLGTNTATTFENLRIIRGYVYIDGRAIAGTGYTSYADGTRTRVDFPAGTFSGSPCVVVSPADPTSPGWMQYTQTITNTGFWCTAALSGVSGASRQTFTFIAIGPR
ncbi:MAG: hypothetical protein JHD00_11050 [Akkermansiaceae bacterium]|nr:hypothetical protein [Akkermansiaceae bacterium]